MSKIKLILLFISSVLVLGGCKQSLQPSSTLELKDHQIVKAKFSNSLPLSMEVVNTPKSIAQGLSGRDGVGVDGMMFIFDQPTIPQFWMKEMKFDLDIIWISQQRIVEISRNVSAPISGTPLSELPTYSPKQSIEMVLEVEAGKATEWELAIGDLVVIE